MEQIHTVLEWIATVIDLTGSIIMVWAFVVAVVSVARSTFASGDAMGRLHDIQVARCGLGIKLVFALELMIVSDLLHSIVSRSLDDLMLLGGLVLIRTVIAYFLNKEIEQGHAELARS